MHDALAYQSYEETIVVDVDDVDDLDTQPIAVPRVPTGDLIVHIQLDDGYHRVSPVGDKTACGDRFNLRLCLMGPKALRRVVHPLAPCQCWTDDEWNDANNEFREQFGKDYAYATRTDHPRFKNR